MEDAKSTGEQWQSDERTFETVLLPKELEAPAERGAEIGEFLHLSDARLQRRTALPRPVAIVTGFAAILAAVLGLYLAATETPLQVALPVAPVTPVTLVAKPAAFVQACEQVVAAGLYTVAPGWRLQTVNCQPNAATLHFSESTSGAPGLPDAEVLSARRPGAAADVLIVLPSSEIPLADFAATAPVLTALHERLQWIDANYNLAPGSSHAPQSPAEARDFTFSTSAPAPVWLAAVESLQGVELTSIHFSAGDLRWRLQGRAHVVLD